MNIFKSKEDSLKFWLSLFLLAGSLAGTWFCNQMTEEMNDFGDEEHPDDWLVDDTYACGVNFPREFEDMLPEEE